MELVRSDLSNQQVQSRAHPSCPARIRMGCSWARQALSNIQKQTASNIRTSCARRPHTDQYEPNKKTDIFLLGSTNSIQQSQLAECCLGRANRIPCRAHNEAGPRIECVQTAGIRGKKSVYQPQELDGAAKPRPSHHNLSVRVILMQRCCFFWFV